MISFSAHLHSQSEYILYSLTLDISEQSGACSHPHITCTSTIEIGQSGTTSSYTRNLHSSTSTSTATVFNGFPESSRLADPLTSLAHQARGRTYKYKPLDHSSGTALPYLRCFSIAKSLYVDWLLVEAITVLVIHRSAVAVAVLCANSIYD